MTSYAITAWFDDGTSVQYDNVIAWDVDTAIDEITMAHGEMPVDYDIRYQRKTADPQ